MMMLRPWQLLSIALAGWINRRRQQVIAYPQEEIRVLRELLGSKRLRFTDEQRKRLAVKAGIVGRKVLRELDGRVTPDTLMNGYRKLVARKYEVARTTLRRILREAGLDPAPGRGKGMSWAEFLRIHWDQIAAADFFTAEVMTLRGAYVSGHWKAFWEWYRAHEARRLYGNVAAVKAPMVGVAA